MDNAFGPAPPTTAAQKLLLWSCALIIGGLPWYFLASRISMPSGVAAACATVSLLLGFFVVDNTSVGIWLRSFRIYIVYNPTPPTTLAQKLVLWSCSLIIGGVPWMFLVSRTSAGSSPLWDLVAATLLAIVLQVLGYFVVNDTSVGIYLRAKVNVVAVLFVAVCTLLYVLCVQLPAYAQAAAAKAASNGAHATCST